MAARLGRDSGGVWSLRAGAGTRPYGSALMKELVQNVGAALVAARLGRGLWRSAGAAGGDKLRPYGSAALKWFL
ncbi:MAG: hypothetical protein ACLRNQ_16530 [Flavonifractor plautii]